MILQVKEASLLPPVERLQYDSPVSLFTTYFLYFRVRLVASSFDACLKAKHMAANDIIVTRWRHRGNFI